MALPDIKHVAFPLHGDIVHEPKFFDQLLQDVLQELKFVEVFINSKGSFTYFEGQSFISQNFICAVYVLVRIFPIVGTMIRAIFNAFVVKYPSLAIIHV